MAAGSRPDEARCYVEKKGDNIAVTDETSAGDGKKSLKVTDAPGLEFAHNPHFFWTPNHRGGQTTFSFDMRVEEGVLMYHEWRDDAKPYQVGPSIWVRDGKLQIHGKDRLKLPVGEWVHSDVRASLGEKSAGVWEASVTLPGRPPVKFENLKSHPEWKTLTWLGFSGNARGKRIFYLDNFKLQSLQSER